MSRNATLWICVAAAPVIWFLSLEANFALAPWLCRKLPTLVSLLISAAALAITAGAAWIGWNHLRRLRPASGPSMALAIGALAINAGAFVVIVAQTIPIAMLAGCP